MLMYPAIDPVAFHIFSWPVYWYGLMYLFGFIIAWFLLSYRLSLPNAPYDKEELSEIFFYSALGVIIGGRLGYMFFYDWQVLFSHPLMVFQTWKGGMSYHGGMIGVMLALYIRSRQTKRPFFGYMDFVAPVVPVGLGLGRIGNFINGELWGRVTDVPWGMVFPNGGPEPRHPSQLYEFFLEGLLFFLILWFFSRKPRPLGAVAGVFSLGYGCFRFAVEFVREPDAPIGYFWGWLTEGQLLSIPLIALGIYLLIWAYTCNQQKVKA